jgi:trimeric autotransporter adhesin
MKMLNKQTITYAAMSLSIMLGIAQPAHAQTAGGTGPGDPATEVCRQIQLTMACGARSSAGQAGQSTYETAVGIQSSALGGNATAIGGLASANGDRSTAIGVLSNANFIGTTVVGHTSFADGFNSTAIGSFARATAANSVALGANSVANVANTVSVGSATQQRQIVNMAAGAVTATSTDAINGSQLFATNSRVSALEALNLNASSQIAGLQSGLNSLEGQLTLNNRQANGGIAAALALGGAAIVPDSNVSMSFNLSTYRGQQGFSGSAIGKVAPKVYVSGGFAGSTVKGSTGGRVGVTFGW